MFKTEIIFILFENPDRKKKQELVLGSWYHSHLLLLTGPHVLISVGYNMVNTHRYLCQLKCSIFFLIKTLNQAIKLFNIFCIYFYQIIYDIYFYLNFKVTIYFKWSFLYHKIKYISFVLFF